MRAKLVRIHGSIAIVLVLEYDLPVVYAIDVKEVRGMKIKEEFDISQDTISAGTEFSVDWDVVIPGGFHISASKIHTALINRGIYTFDDYRNNQRIVNDALNVFVGELRVQLSNKVKDMIGG